jgi:hypothetical protein
MLADVTMPRLMAAAAKPHQRYSKKKERFLDIKKFEALCSFPWDSSPGSSWHAGSGVRITS